MTHPPDFTPDPGTLTEAHQAPAPELNDAQTEAVSERALSGRPSGAVRVGDRDVPIVLVPLEVEIPLGDCLNNHMAFLHEYWIKEHTGSPGVFEAALMASIRTSLRTDLLVMAIAIMRYHYPDEFKTEPDAIAWLRKNAHLEEITELVRRQIVENKLADSLGKLWGRVVFAEKMAAALLITGSQATQPGTAPSKTSASGTASTQETPTDATPAP